MPDPTPPADFAIKPPADSTAQTPAPPATGVPAATGTATGVATGAPISADALPGAPGLSVVGITIGIAILLVLTAILLLLRGAVRGHLISARASPSAAGNAGWALFSFLMSLSILIVFGLIGSLWQVVAFVVPLLLLVVVTLILFVLLYRSATRGRSSRRLR